MIPAIATTVVRRPIGMNGVIASVRTTVVRKYCSCHGRNGQYFYPQSHVAGRSGLYHLTSAAAPTDRSRRPASASSFFSSTHSFSSATKSTTTTTTTSTATADTIPNDDQTSHPNNPPCWRFAIVGSGPSGCYTAKYLQHAFTNLTHNKTTLLDKVNDEDSNNNHHQPQAGANLHIDIFERLPTPYGLVRNGVAPDHPDVKNVQNDFEKQVFSSSPPPVTTTTTTSTTTVHFYGNVEIGRDLSLNELRQHYDGVILAYGCESDRPLSLPGHDLRGILCAREFVAWYNGHPDYEHVGDTVRMALLTSSGVDGMNGGLNHKYIVVIGHGNVALDCARILAKPYNELVQTDLATRALDVLWDTTTTKTNTMTLLNEATTNTTPSPPTLPPSQPTPPTGRHITVVGRRGHVQAAFTIKEIRELIKLPEETSSSSSTYPIRFRIRLSELEAGKATAASKLELKSSKPKQRLDALLTEYAAKANDDDDDSDEVPTDQTCTIDLRFLLNPVRYEPKDDEDDGTGPRLGSVLCERMELVGDVGCQSAIGTGNFERLKADLCLVSIGYKGVPIAGTECYYDDVRGILTNIHGVVDGPVKLSSSTDVDDTNTTKEHPSSNSPQPQEQSHVLAPLYVSGWLKRGPSGIIGTNIADAKETVASIMKDVLDGRITMSSNVVTQDPTLSSIQDLLQERNVQVVDWHAYQRINDKETSDGYKRHLNQPREKITVWTELLETALGEAAAVPQPKK